MMDGLVCAYCGAKRDRVTFCIGASREEDKEWTMWEGTGKVSCPDSMCWHKASREGRLAIERHTGLREEV